MKLTKKLEAEVLQVYDTWLNSYLNGDVKTYDHYFDDEYRFIGSTGNEEFLNRKDTTKFFEVTADQLAGKTDIRNSNKTIELFGELIFITQLLDAWFLNGTEWAYYGRFRFTSVLRKNKEGWRFIYQHFSTPDLKAAEGETIGYEKITAENLELREAVRRRTIELNEKNRELEIEVSLERVRASAMAMHRSDELSDVLTVLFEQFDVLNIRPVDVHLDLFDLEKNTFSYRATGKEGKRVIAEQIVDLDSRPEWQALVEKWKNGKPNTVDFSFYPKEVISALMAFFPDIWAAMPEDAIMKPEDFPDGIFDTLGYCKFGYIGMHHRRKATEEEQKILIRFANEFERLYQRFLDLQKAEAQAREAQIELGLERVRARAMAMHSSEELKDAAILLYHELKALGVKQFINCGYVLIDEKANLQHAWMTHADGTIRDAHQMPLTGDLVMNERYENWKRKVAVFCQKLGGKQLKNHQQFVSSYIKSSGGTENVTLPDPTFFYCGNFSKGYLHLVATEKLNKEAEVTISRFTTVFEITYRRFLDLQKAEAQAREAKIELGLERVRARAMAMQQSDELKELIGTVYAELSKLNISLDRCLIWVMNSEDYSTKLWMAGAEALPVSFYVPYHENPPYLSFIKGWKERNTKWEYDLGGQIKKDWDEFVFNNTEMKYLPEPVKKGMQASERIIMAGSFQKFGCLQTAGPEPLKEEQFEVLNRFAQVFDSTYTRFNDLQKAEAQAREAKIEAALEKVRSRSLAMHKSDEIKDVVATVMEKMTELDIEINGGVSLVTFTPASKDFHHWFANPGQISAPLSMHLPYFDNLIFNDCIDAREKGMELFAKVYSFEEKIDFFGYAFEHSELKNAPEHWKNWIMEQPYFGFSLALQKNSAIFLNDYTGKLFSEQENELLKRFAKVFEQAYVRFLDLQKAEAQTREAKIEAALERVRSRTMAMQHSDELQDTALLLFQQVQALGVLSFAAGFNIWDDDRKAATAWMAGEGRLQPPFKTSSSEDVFFYIHEAAQRGEQLFIAEQGGEKLETHYRYMASIPVFKEVMEKMSQAGYSVPTFQIIHCAFFSQGYLMFISFAPVPEANDIFKRFAKVFEQTYTRFLDLQKAEAQAREAKIELALERVRAKTMALQKSDELREVVVTLYEQLRQLHFDSKACNIIIIDKQSNNQQYWVSGFTQDIYPESYNVPYFKHPYLDAQLEPWKKGEKYEVIEYSGKTLRHYNETFFAQTDFKNIPEESQEYMRSLELVKLSTAYFSYGALQMIGAEPLTEQNASILQRFAKVFEQTYTRFLDLQKAEAQAREAEIELALERIRARTMAMQKSDELPEAANLLFLQVQALGMPAWSAGYCILDEDKKAITLWMSSEGVMQPPFRAPLTEDPSFIHMREAHERGESFFVEEIGGDELVTHYKYMRTLPVVGEILDSIIEAGHPLPTFQIFHLAYFSQGFLLFITYEPVPDAHEIFKRFGKVFDQTYTRFLDLQKAEAQAREAKIEAALERVRSRSMGMQKSEELKEVIQVVYEQFVLLGIHIEHTGFIMDYKTKDEMHIWLADKHEVPAEVTIPYFDCAHWNSFNESKEKGTDFFANHLTFEEKNKFYQDLFKLLPGVPQETLDYYFSCPGLAISTVLLDDVGLYIENFSGIPYTEEENNTLMRFGKVFQQTYTRFLDLQKAEAQAREAEIELALERVRARTMAMQRSDELPETSFLLFHQFRELGENAEQISIGIMNEEDHVMELSATLYGNRLQQTLKLKIDESSVQKKIYNAWKQKKKSIVIDLAGKELQEYNVYRNNLSGYQGVKFDEDDENHWIINVAFFSKGMLSFSTHEHHPPETIQLLERFAQVFDQTYTRFLDLQKAESQAREANIETALERVRSKTMAMQRSDELLDVASVLFQQVKALGVPQWNCGFNIWDIGDKEFTYYPGSPDGKILPSPCKIPLTEHPVFMRFDESRKRGDELLIYEKQGEEQKDHYQYMLSLPGVGDLLKSMLDAGFKLPTFQIDHLANFAYGNLIFITYEHFPEMHDVFKRFARVFEQTYTRFLDLQKAEAQAREAQIQLAMERVRARTMAMQKSDELPEAANLLFQQVQVLGMPAWSAGYCIWDDNKKAITAWMSSEGVLQPSFRAPLTEDSSFINMREAYERGETFHVEEIGGDELVQHYKYMRTLPVVGDVLDSIIEAGHPLPTFQIFHCIYFSQGFLLFITYEPVPDAHDIFKRFGKVFDQTYTRFLDLQKAEAQAREAKIEAALERVRSQSMGMQTSKDLSNVTTAMFEQLRMLGGELYATGIVFCDKYENHVEQWHSVPGAGMLSPFIVPVDLDHIHQYRYDQWKKGTELFSVEIPKDFIAQHFDAMFNLPTVKAVLEDFAAKNIPMPETPSWEIDYGASFKHGYILVSALQPFSDADILPRFAKVFDQTYTRFLDLQKVEAQVREAKIEAALERVRSRTLAMQTSNELAETAAVLFRQLILLGIEPNRLYINIIKNENGEAEFWITDEDGSKVSSAFESNMNDNPSFKRMFEGWKEKKKSLLIDMKEKELKEYFLHLESLHVPFKDGLTQKRRLQYVAYFNKGFIGLASPDEQPEETMLLLERFAAVFNLTFTRFNDLKIAEGHAIQAEEDLIKLQTEKKRVEDALTELQITQKQLIQSEKMASLGELTAGIAHEIQNPLNFVNNFSEVSNELIDELKEEFTKGNTADVFAIADDLKLNLEKINHHGKRADAIVKGMLQHSQASSATKEPTDINKLADEYLRLSYHGLRAKDKSFNATLETDFDETIGDINIIPQDIGRVILNLITNAFYAVDEKKKLVGEGYEPTVLVSTKKLNDKVEIKVSDNGNGIPPKVLDKIFQPFFTTKPTGQGTGLGLSLAYDIAKAHGGEIKVSTKENEETKFTIILPA